MKPTILSRPLTFKGMALATAAVAGFGLGQAQAKTADLDGDGIANLLDPDVDGDGIANGRDLNVDGGVCRRGPFKGKYVGDRLLNGSRNEKDIDADGLKDSSLVELDIDGDSKKDNAAREKDIDGDGLANTDSNENDIDGDGISDDLDGDCDGDGKDRDQDKDDDADGISDDSDGDDDDGIPDDSEGDDDDDGSLGGTGTVGGTSALYELVSFPEVTLTIGGLSETWAIGSATAALIENFATSNPADVAIWLEWISRTDRSIDPLLLDSLWEITYPEDPATTGRDDRRSRETVEEPSADETVPAP